MLQHNNNVRSAVNEYRTCINCKNCQSLTIMESNSSTISGLYCEKFRDETVSWHWCQHWSIRIQGSGVTYVFDRTTKP